MEHVSCSPYRRSQGTPSGLSGFDARCPTPSRRRATGTWPNGDPAEDQQPTRHPPGAQPIAGHVPQGGGGHRLQHEQQRGPGRPDAALAPHLEREGEGRHRRPREGGGQPRPGGEGVADEEQPGGYALQGADDEQLHGGEPEGAVRGARSASSTMWTAKATAHPRVSSSPRSWAVGLICSAHTASAAS